LENKIRELENGLSTRIAKLRLEQSTREREDRETQARIRREQGDLERQRSQDIARFNAERDSLMSSVRVLQSEQTTNTRTTATTNTNTRRRNSAHPLLAEPTPFGL